MRRAVFLDRDGTIIRDAHFLSDLADLEILPGAAEALRKLGDAGFTRLVVTNQSGVARGYFDLAFVDEVHRELRRRLREQGADVEGFYVCPHHPEHTGPCSCRKPAPGFLWQAEAEWSLDLRGSWMVGDKACDVELARAAGCRAGLVRTGSGAKTEACGVGADAVADDLAGIAEEILRS